MKKMSKLVSLLLALCLLLALLPATALAAGDFSIDSNNVLTKYNGPGGHVTIPEGVTAIGNYAFQDRTDITGVTIPNTVTTIGAVGGSGAFRGCTGLTEITIPDSVTTIWNNTFSGCTGLTSVVIPDSVTTLGQYVFRDCTGLTSAVVGSGLKDIETGIFYNCTSLTSVTLKEGIQKIGDSMFQNCSSLTSVKIPDSVEVIYLYAFMSCTNLREVDLGNKVRKIWGNAFTSCPNLKDITLPASITNLDVNAFGGQNRFDDPYTELDTITLAEGTKTIPNLSYGAYSSPALTKLYVPASVTAVADGALDKFSDLTVYGVKDSYMESWCALRGIPFVGSEPAIPEPTFTDVAENAYYADPVNWAVKQQITSGTSATTFSPDSTCTQGQILTFLWRSQGEPAPTGAVNGTQYYAKAAQWAKEQGLTDDFSADAPCTRAMVVTYLWKLAGSPAASGSRFTDVPAEYAAAVTWAVNKGVTAGTGATTFSPGAICTRGQIVTFLYRAYK